MTTSDNSGLSPDPVLDPFSIQQLKDLDESGTGDLLNELIDTFLKDADQRLVDVRRAFERGDRKTISNTAHTLKGGASNFGAKRFSSHCHQMQIMSPDLSAGEVQYLIEVLEGEYALLKTALIQHQS